MTLTPIQRDALIKPIAQARVSKNPRGYSHVEAYDVRRRLIEIFDFAGWSGQVLSMDLVYEDHEVKQKWDKREKKYIEGSDYVAWSICYRCTYQLTIHATGAIYTESATGDATNQPSRADAHDNALKSAESQAFKRAAMNLGSQFGLSLYAKGSTAPIVRHILVNDLMRIDAASNEITRAQGNSASVNTGSIDTTDHVTEPVAPEMDPDEPAPPKPTTAELDAEAADRKGITPEQERADRLAEGKVRRDALGVKSDGRLPQAEQERITRATGPLADDPWAGRANPTQGEIDV